MFALVRELKNHFTYIPLLHGGKLKCGDYNANELIATSPLVSSEESSVPPMATSPQSAVGHTTGTPGGEEIRFYAG